jgi:hypothetical protein
MWLNKQETGPLRGPPADLSERDFLDYGKIVVETKMTITK